MQNTHVASSYIQENIPIWFSLTAFEELEHRCRGGGGGGFEYIRRVGLTLSRHLLLRRTEAAAERRQSQERSHFLLYSGIVRVRISSIFPMREGKRKTQLGQKL